VGSLTAGCRTALNEEVILMFEAFLRPSPKGGKKALKVGDHLALSTRSNGSTGWVLVLGLCKHADGEYPSRKRPIRVRLQYTAKDGSLTEGTLSVTDADGVHLAQGANLAEVQALIASLKDVKVLELTAS